MYPESNWMFLVFGIFRGNCENLLKKALRHQIGCGERNFNQVNVLRNGGTDFDCFCIAFLSIDN